MIQSVHILHIYYLSILLCMYDNLQHNATHEIISIFYLTQLSDQRQVAQINFPKDITTIVRTTSTTASSNVQANAGQEAHSEPDQRNAVVKVKLSKPTTTTTSKKEETTSSPSPTKVSSWRISKPEIPNREETSPSATKPSTLNSKKETGSSQGHVSLFLPSKASIRLEKPIGLKKEESSPRLRPSSRASRFEKPAVVEDPRASLKAASMALRPARSSSSSRSTKTLSRSKSQKAVRIYTICILHFSCQSATLQSSCISRLMC